MTGIGVECLKQGISGVFSTVKFVITTLKNASQIKKEIADIDGGEIVGIVTEIVTIELPPIWEALKKPKPEPK